MDSQKKILIFGSNGLIGSTLKNYLAGKGAIVSDISWQDINIAFQHSQFDIMYDIIGKCIGLTAPADIIFCNGIIDPARDVEEIIQSNVSFPLCVMSLLSSHHQVRFVTLGSIQEHFPDYCEKNPYLYSKLELGRRVAQLASEHQYKNRMIHLQLHTVFGDRFPSHMFLGQILSAIQNEMTFKMSAGDQLREYQHVDDVAIGIAKTLDTDFFTPIIHFSSGVSIRLADLAKKIFSDFHCINLLEIGGLDTPAGENVNKKFTNEHPHLFQSRPDVISHLINSIKLQLGEKE